ncbi:MAG TPA: diguanylate cyclase [Halanaerobiales bacterium]|nr:diguanylate cyclase [Halanaerobiales bacterium]
MNNILLNILLVIFLVYLFNKLKTKYSDSLDMPNYLSYENLFDKLEVPMLLLGKENEVVRYNDSFIDQFDLDEKEIEGEPFNSVFEIEGSETGFNHILEKFNSGEKYKGKIMFFDKKDKRYECELKLYPIFENDELVGKHIIINQIDKEEEKISSALRESRRKIRDLHQTALKMENVRTKKEVYDLTVKAAENILDFDLCTLDIVEGNKMVVKATSSNIIPGESISSPLDVDSIATQVYKNKQALLSPDIQKEEFANPTSSKYHSALTIPIGERGIFQAVSTKVNEFTREDLELVELLIAHALSALQRLEMDQEIRYLGFHDSLTGLYNRHYLNEEINRLDTKRQLPISVIIGDLNGLKLINDIFGHEEGDKFLKKAAELLKDCVREEDILGRWGGDEFMIILPKTSCQEADEILARINRKVQKTYKEKRPISISLGRATKDINFADSFNKVIEEADYKMYKNKAIMHEEDNNPLVEMIKEKMQKKELKKGEVYRLDSLLNMFKNNPFER